MGFLIGDADPFRTWGRLRTVINNGESGYTFSASANAEYIAGLYPTNSRFIRAWNTPTTFFGQPSIEPVSFGGPWTLIASGIEDKAKAQIIGETGTFDTTETITVTTDAFTGGQSFTPALPPSYLLSLGKFTRIT
jgi:hypothetical protein